MMDTFLYQIDDKYDIYSSSALFGQLLYTHVPNILLIDTHVILLALSRDPFFLCECDMISTPLFKHKTHLFFLLFIIKRRKIMESDQDTFHVVIRLPFKRPAGFIEPPAVSLTEMTCSKTEFFLFV